MDTFTLESLRVLDLGANHNSIERTQEYKVGASEGRYLMIEGELEK